jgi:electron transfer flavoprotein beta subunit
MKIVVPIKVAGSLDETAKLQNGEVDVSSLEFDVNEWDRFAVEAALELRDDNEGEVVVISVGGDEVEDGLLTALAMGADRGIQVEVEDEAKKLDAITVAKVIAKAIESESADLVLCGTQSSDGASAATGTALAALLGLPRVAVVRSIDYAGGELTVRRELEGGLLEQVKVSTPALLTVQTGINEPRYATLRGIRQAGSKPRDEKTLDDLGLDEDTLAGESAQQLSLASPPESEGAEILEGDAASIAAQIASIIKKKVGA